MSLPDRLLRTAALAAVCVCGTAVLSACSDRNATASTQTAGAAAPAVDMVAMQNKHLAVLDDMDLNIFSKKEWDRIKESHADDIWVQNPDTTVTTGLPVHIEGMKQMAAFMPDMRIVSHPVKIASGDWTAITAVFEGTFTKPMPNPAGGPPIQPTGKAFKSNIATISHWNKNGLMDKEYVFMDGADFAKQLGIAPGKPAVKGDPGPMPISNADEGVPSAEVQRRMGVLDNMDFVVWSNQQWDKIHESHSDDVIAVFPDGRVSRGIGQHIEDMKQMFTWAPDSKIHVHPVKFGQGNWTALIGEMEGDFTKPMMMPGMKPIAPTGKHFKMPMATYSHWNKDGKMDIEFVFWDNAAWMKQIGVA